MQQVHRHTRKKKNSNETHKNLRIDNLIYIAAIVSPLMSIPQIYDVWVKNLYDGLSAISWSSYLFFSLVWLLYGLFHRDRPLIISSVLWTVSNAMILVRIV